VSLGHVAVLYEPPRLSEVEDSFTINMSPANFVGGKGGISGTEEHLKHDIR